MSKRGQRGLTGLAPGCTASKRQDWDSEGVTRDPGADRTTVARALPSRSHPPTRPNQHCRFQLRCRLRGPAHQTAGPEPASGPTVRPDPHHGSELLPRRLGMDLGTRHQEPPSRASQAPQQQRRQHRHDRTKWSAESGHTESKVGKSKWQPRPEAPELGRLGKGGPKTSRT